MSRKEEIEVAGATKSDRNPERVDEERQASALAIHEVLRVEGEHELERANRSLVFSGIASGLSMGLSMAAAGLLHSLLDPTPIRPLLTAIGFTLGFIVVIVGRQGLLTDHAVTGVLPVLSGTGTVRRLLATWTLLLAANLIGAAIFAGFAARTNLFDHEANLAFSVMAHEAMAPSFGTQVLRALFAGWLVGLAVWTAVPAGGARVFMIMFLTWMIAVANFGHVIGGAVEVFYGAFSGQFGLVDAFTRFILPVLAGNLLGGALLVAMLNHLQVRKERAKHVAGITQPRAPARRRARRSAPRRHAWEG